MLTRAATTRVGFERRVAIRRRSAISRSRSVTVACSMASPAAPLARVGVGDGPGDHRSGPCLGLDVGHRIAPFNPPGPVLSGPPLGVECSITRSMKP